MGCLARAETDRFILTSGATAVRQLTCVACCAMTLKTTRDPFTTVVPTLILLNIVAFPKMYFFM